MKEDTAAAIFTIDPEVIPREGVERGARGVEHVPREMDRDPERGS